MADVLYLISDEQVSAPRRKAVCPSTETQVNAVEPCVGPNWSAAYLLLVPQRVDGI
jgi:hypothetical protein